MGPVERRSGCAAHNRKSRIQNRKYLRVVTPPALFGGMPRPNILWIVTTQWRAQAAGYAGDPNARTPHLDALVAQAVNYAQAVTPHPFGPFARAALLTGVPSPANGVRDYFDPLPPDAHTIAHEMAARDYATAFFGKWHLAKRDPHAPLVGEAHAKTIVPPEARGGFEFWEGFESGFLLNDPWLHGTRLPEPVRCSGYQADVICRRAAAWIAECGLRVADLRVRNPQSVFRNWFCVVSLEAPHPPYGAPAAGIAARAPEALALPANVPRGGEVEVKARAELAGYYAHLEATDRAIGQGLLASLPENTIVVFTSVHGDMHGAHGLFRKGWPHEESVRVPLLVRRTDARSPEFGVRSFELVSLLDLPGWTMAWADGSELQTPSSKRQAECVQRISMPSVVALPHQCDRMWRGGRTRERKQVLNADGTPWLFFDQAADPFEQRNLAGEPAHAAEIAAWRARIEAPDAAAKR
jgi:arylsulfatase A-like enzyme